ncbi:unnamed protein product [Lepeophtheirus salmonis]|uniref:(salmon louse) hypothetical protein n=1 Tax=Lepeophtheirus salmonis TaxID=72036 RepID=A0A7R8CTW7_LEPSM|nr:unnamed protein product [Lepeophtheirus salmonis]CAF2894232.1 unnamed protein product [Lepeophtheirus salmonis]
MLHKQRLVAYGQPKDLQCPDSYLFSLSSPMGHSTTPNSRSSKVHAELYKLRNTILFKPLTNIVSVIPNVKKTRKKLGNHDQYGCSIHHKSIAVQLTLLREIIHLMIKKNNQIRLCGRQLVYAIRLACLQKHRYKRSSPEEFIEAVNNYHAYVSTQGQQLNQGTVMNALHSLQLQRIVKRSTGVSDHCCRQSCSQSNAVIQGSKLTDQLTKQPIKWRVVEMKKESELGRDRGSDLIHNARLMNKELPSNLLLSN